MTKHLIDLGAASLETRGGDPVALDDEGIGVPLGGLRSDD